MSHEPLTQMPNKNPKAVKTAIGWAHSETGEQLTSMRGLPPPVAEYYKPNSGKNSFVDPNLVVVASVTISPKTTSIKVGATRKLTPTVSPEDATNKDVNYTTSDPSVATVGVDGTVTALTVGSATITVSSVDNPGATDTCAVTVTPNAVTGVTLNKSNLVLAAGASERLTPVVEPAHATNKSVTWASSNPKITVSADGNVTMTSELDQTTVITVTTVDGGFTATCSVIGPTTPAG